MVALLVATAGTAAGVTGATAFITGAEVVNESLTGKDVRNKSLSKADFKGSVQGARGARGVPGAQGAQGIQGIQGTQGIQGLKGDKGDKGDTGVPGSARAYAVVTNSATFNAARTFGFTAVSRPSTGIYCLTPAAGINPGTHPAVASPEWNNSAGADLRVAVAATFAFLGCTSSQYEIVTLSGSPPVFANNVAFTVIVP